MKIAYQNRRVRPLVCSARCWVILQSDQVRLRESKDDFQGLIQRVQGGFFQFTAYFDQTDPVMFLTWI